MTTRLINNTELLLKVKLTKFYLLLLGVFAILNNVVVIPPASTNQKPLQINENSCPVRAGVTMMLACKVGYNLRLSKMIKNNLREEETSIFLRKITFYIVTQI